MHQLARHSEISTTRWLHENFVVPLNPFLHYPFYLDKALNENPIFMQVGSFCTSNLSSVSALQQYFVIHNKLPGGIKELDDEYFGSRLLCPILFICSDHVWNQSYWSVIIRASQPTYFLMKVSVKQCVNRLSLKEIISWLRMNFWSWKIMDWANAIIVCTMFGAWIWKRWIT